LIPSVGLWHHARRALCATGVVLLWCVGGRSAAAQSGKRFVEQPAIDALKIDGNVNISTEELKAAMVTEPSHCRAWKFCGILRFGSLRKDVRLDRAELDRDLLRLRVLYWKRGWRTAQVTPVITPRTRKTVSIALKVVEGPPTLIGTIELGALDSLLAVRGLRKLVDLRPGDPLDLIHLDSVAVRIVRRLDAEGYGEVLLNPVAVVDTSSPRARVTMGISKLYETRVEAVRVEGTENYDPRVVANTMGLKAGDIYSRFAVAESQRALYEAGYFKRAFVRVDPGSADSLKKLVAAVEELPTRSFRTTGGLSTVEFFQVDARYQNANFRGNAGRLTMQATLGNLLAPQLNNRLPFQNVLPENLVDVDSAPAYLQPTFQLNAEVRRRWLSDSRNQTGVSVFGYRRSSPGVFVDQGAGVGGSFTRNVTRAIPVSAQYRLEFTKVSAADTYFCVNFGVCDEVSLGVLKRTQRLAPLSLAASTDRRDDPLGPTRGYTWRADMEFASRWTGSQFGYGRIEVDASKYFHSSEKLTVAMRVHAGYVRGERADGDSVPIILPRKRFYAGGARSVRGYGENQLGPRVLVIPRRQFQPGIAAFDSLINDPRLNDGRLPCDILVDLPNCLTSQTGAPLRNGRPTSNFEDGDFTPKPLGASTLVEASIEARYRVGAAITLAAFVDAGSVGARFGGTAAVFTPGIGVRYLSPIGPIRVDLGYNPKADEQLSVITELSQPRDSTWLNALGIQRGLTGDALTAFAKTTGLFQINAQRSFNPATGTGLGGFFNRMTLHLSIGEAF
jgi:outer membrane protein insertion porin family